MTPTRLCKRSAVVAMGGNGGAHGERRGRHPALLSWACGAAMLPALLLLMMRCSPSTPGSPESPAPVNVGTDLNPRSLNVFGDVNFVGQLRRQGIAWDSSPWATSGGTLSYLGNVGIGTTLTSGYRLAVQGTVACRELVINQTPWADHVFADGYRLASLDDLEEFVRTEKHLPGIPTAEQVRKEGVSVGEMQAKMLEKLEEMTLYMIQLRKENSEMRERVKALEDSLAGDR